MIRPLELSGAGRTSEVNDEFGPAKYFCSNLQVTFRCRKILRQGLLALLPPHPEGRRATDFYRP
jgi:hypothetical protein